MVEHSGRGSVRLIVGLDDLKSLFKPKCFYDSNIRTSRRFPDQQA